MREAVIFDTHAYVKKLKAVGFTEEQSEVQTEALSELIEEGLATKRDLRELDVALQTNIKELEVALRTDI
ncbi:MAG: DUF1640 domain-containing protein [Nitrospirae bacterium]|nr:DUF1640 domain-containing protein [Nitrospirota bacterium]